MSDGKKYICIGVAFSVLVPVLLTGCGRSAEEVTNSRASDQLSTQTLYRPQQDPAEYESAPSGYRPVFTEHVARHGSRTVSAGGEATLALAEWAATRPESVMTELGKTYPEQYRIVREMNDRIGTGLETELGRAQHRDMAHRVQSRLPGIFTDLDRGAGRIEVDSSPVKRAQESADAFVAELKQNSPALDSRIGDLQVKPDLLYFHKTGAENIADQKKIAKDPRIADAMAEIVSGEGIQRATRAVLSRLFVPDFVEEIMRGEAQDVPNGKARVAPQSVGFSIVYSIYQTLCLSVNLGDEYQGEMGRYFSASDLADISSHVDAKQFYEKGPGFEGSDINYKMASVLLDDFFTQAEKPEGGAVFRFAHAETVIPLAALMKLPGSTETATVDKPYSYETNSWRGGAVSPMAANIWWDVYRNDTGDVLVKMLYNEKETRFKDECKAVQPDSYFYSLKDLKTCFGKA